MKNFTHPCHQKLFDLALQASNRAIFIHPYSILGCIFGAAAAPEIPLPDRWLPWIFKGPVSEQFSQQVDEMSELAMLSLQWQLQQMRDGNIVLMEGITCPKPPFKDCALSYWLQGLLLAHSQLNQTWEKAWQAMLVKPSANVITLQKDLKHCLGLFSTFADIPFAIQQATNKGNDQLADKLPSIYFSLPASLRTYVKTSGSLVDYLPNQFETFVQPSNVG